MNEGVVGKFFLFNEILSSEDVPELSDEGIEVMEGYIRSRHAQSFIQTEEANFALKRIGLEGDLQKEQIF